MQKSTQRVTVLVVALLMIGWPISMAVPGGAVAEQQSNHDQIQLNQIGGDEFSEVEDGLEVWERSVLPFRAPADDAATSIPVEDSAGHQLRLETDDGDGPANRDFIGVFDDHDIEIEFAQTQFADTNRDEFNDADDVQVIIAEFDDPDQDTDEVAGLDQLSDVVDPALDGDFDELQDQAEDRGVTFNINDIDDGPIDDGSFTYQEFNDDSDGEPGPHIILLAIPQDDDSNGFTTDEQGGLDILTLEDGNEATIIGVESVLVQQDSSEITFDDAVAPGDDIVVDYVTDVGDDETQSVLVYHEETFLDERTNVVVDGELGTSLEEDDITIEHTIENVNGNGSMTQAGNVFGTDASQRVITGTTPLGDIVDRLTDEADLDTNNESIGDTTLNASGVTNPEADEDGEIAVETFDNWTTGEYRVIHAAEDGTVGGVETTTDTIEVFEFEALDLQLDNSVIAEGDGETNARALADRSDGEEVDVTDDAEFESSNEDVATVDDTGVITAGDAGTTTITATFDDGPSGNEFTASAELSVGLVEEIDVEIDPDRIFFGGGVDNEPTEADFDITATVSDGEQAVLNDGDLELEFDEDLIDIDREAGIVTADGEGGSTEIEAELQGETDSVNIRTVRIERVTIDQGEQVEQGQSTVTFDDVDQDGDVRLQTGDSTEDEIDGVDQAAATTIELDTAEVNTATLEFAIPEADIGPDTEAEFGNEGVIFIDDSELAGDTIDPSADRVEFELVGGEFIIEVEVSFSEVTVAVGTEDPDPTPTTGTGGGGGGGGGGTVLPTEPSVTSGQSVSIADGVATFTLTSMQSITFEDATAEGTVGVDELDGIPNDQPPLGAGQPFVTGFAISVPDTQVNQSATLQAEISNERIEAAGVEAENLVILRAVDDGYQQLDTAVEMTDDGAVVEAETPGFSFFVVSAAEPDPEPDEETPDPEEEETPEPEEETPEPDDQAGFGLLVAILSLLAAALLALRRRRPVSG